MSFSLTFAPPPPRMSAYERGRVNARQRGYEAGLAGRPPKPPRSDQHIAPYMSGYRQGSASRET